MLRRFNGMVRPISVAQKLPNRSIVAIALHGRRLGYIQRDGATIAFHPSRRPTSLG
jgi:hypothetical protein